MLSLCVVYLAVFWAAITWWRALSLFLLCVCFTVCRWCDTQYLGHPPARPSLPTSFFAPYLVFCAFPWLFPQASMLPLLRRPSLKELLRPTREAMVCKMDLSHKRVMRDGGVLRIQPLQVWKPYNIVLSIACFLWMVVLRNVYLCFVIFVFVFLRTHLFVYTRILIYVHVVFYRHLYLSAQPTRRSFFFFFYFLTAFWTKAVITGASRPSSLPGVCLHFSRALRV